jgi:hypothetical protein
MQNHLQQKTMIWYQYDIDIFKHRRRRDDLNTF